MVLFSVIVKSFNKGFPMYYIVMKQTDGRLATVYLNRRSYWKIKTAKKHLRRLVREQVANELADVKYFSLQLV